VELHYRLVLPTVAMSPQALAFVEREIWTDPGTAAIGPRRVPVPAPEMMLAHLVIHALLDHELNNGPLFLADVMHLVTSGRINADRCREIVAGSQLEAAIELTAGMLPAPERMILTGGAKCRIRLPASTIRSLMLQAAKSRNRVKLRATFVDARPRKRIALVLRKVLPGRTVLVARWRSEVGPEGGRPGNTLNLWLGYLARKIAQHLLQRSNADKLTLQHLRSLRRALSHRPSL
jgi:hypothetical protein